MQDLQDMCKIKCKILQVLQEKYLQVLVEDSSSIIRGAWDLVSCFQIFYAQALID